MHKEDKRVSCVEIIYDSEADTNSCESYESILPNSERVLEMPNDMHSYLCQHMEISQVDEPVLLDSKRVSDMPDDMIQYL